MPPFLLPLPTPPRGIRGGRRREPPGGEVAARGGALQPAEGWMELKMAAKKGAERLPAAPT